MNRALAMAALGLAGLSSPAGARELWSLGEASLDWSGTVREIAVATRGTDEDAFRDAAAANLVVCSEAASFADCPAFGTVGEDGVYTSLTRLRNRVDLRVTPHWSAVVLYDHELLTGTLDTFEARLGDSLMTDSFLEAESKIVNDRHAIWRHQLYRGFLFFESDAVEVVLGRQRIAWGVGRLWNPIDRFNAIPPLAIEGDQSPGVDALQLRWLVGELTSVEAIYAPERDHEDSDYALRLYGVAFDVDYSLVAGVFDAAPTFGLDLAGNLGEAAARMEVVYANPSRNVWPVGDAGQGELDDFWQVVASIDHVFDVGSGLYALAEYFYNGNGLGFGSGRAGALLPFFESTNRCPAAGLTAPCVRSASSDRLGGSRVVTRSEHLSGVQLGYDVTPEIRAELLALQDWDGRSVSFFPTLRYAPVDWLELTLGAQAFAGRRQSEYGDADALGFLLLDAFF